MTTGPEAYRQAANLAAEAYKRLSEGEEESAAAWAAVAQVYATLAQAAATALGDHSPMDGQEWRKVAATKASGMPGP
jgi:hypothetical protein